MSSDDIIQIQQLICREREGRDRQWWQEMRQALHPDAFIDISWYQGTRDGFIDGSIEMAKRGTATNHRLRPIAVRVKGDRAVATLSAAIESRLMLGGVEADLDSQARLIYKAIREDTTKTDWLTGGNRGSWRLYGLNVVYQRDTLAAAMPGQPLSIDVEQLKAYRSSYRCLSYVLEEKGFPVNQKLPGDDRPQQVEALYHDALQWLGEGQ